MPVPYAYRWLFALALLAWWQTAFAQPGQPASQVPALPVQCSTAAESRPYGALRRALAGNRVVMLGEQTHFDGATFEAKIALIQFLHDSLGYNTLAFEGDFYALDKGYRQLAAGQPVAPVLQRSVYEGIWSGTAEFEKLTAYLTKHRELRLAGFDCQQFGEYTKELLLPELRSFVAKDPRTRWTAADFYPGQELLAELTSGDFANLVRHPGDTVRIARWVARCRTSLAYIAARQPAQASRARFWQQWLRSTTGAQRDAMAAARGVPDIVQNRRDALMADNLLFLARQPENAKIIVWAATYHVANKISRLDLDDSVTARYVRRVAADSTDNQEVTARRLLGGGIPMGELVKRRLGKAVFALGFVAGGGSYGRKGQRGDIRPQAVPEPPAGSAEAAFRAQGCADGFVDLRTIPAGTAFYASPLGYLPLRGPWAEVLDGLYYTPTMRPTTPAGLVATPAPPAAGYRLLGQVVDEKTGTGISFASVTIAGTGQGTVTNQAGSFALFVPAGPRADSVRITCLGYGSARLPARPSGPAPVVIRLKPQARMLGNVLVTAPPTPEIILRKAYENITINYPQQANSMQLYTRKRHWRNDSLRTTHEAALDFYDQEGYRRGSWEHIQKQRFLQMRQQRRTGISDSAQEAPDFWLLWTADPVLTPENPLEPGPSEKYTFSLDGQTEYDGKSVYKVNFVCQRPSAFTTPYGYPAPESYQGAVYITTDTYAIVKYEAFTVRAPYEIKRDKLLRQLNLPAPSSRRRTNHDIYQYEQLRGIYYLKYAQRENESVYTDLASGSIQRRQRESTELLATSIRLSQPLVLQSSGLRVDKRVPYRPEFWDSYQVIMPTAVGNPSGH